MLRIKIKGINIINTVPFMMIVLMPYLPCNGVDIRVFGISIYQFFHILNYFLAVIFLTRRNYKPSAAVIIGSLFYIWMIITTLINHADTTGLFARVLQCIAFLIISDYFLKYSMRKYCLSIIILMLCIMIINVPIQLVNMGTFTFGQDNGINNVNFFMSDNFAGYYIVAVLCVCYIYIAEYKNQKTKVICNILIILMLASTIISWSGTGVFGTFLFMTIAIFVTRNNQRAISRIEKRYNGKSVFIICIVFFLAFVVFRLQNLFSVLIEGVLHKSLTFTGRTILWDYAFAKIASSPIIGIGSSASGRTFVGNIGYYEHTAHNMILEIILQGGLIALIIFLSWMLFSIRYMQKKKPNQLMLYIITAILAEFIMYMFEGVIYYQFPFILFILAYHIQDNQGTEIHKQRHLA